MSKRKRALIINLEPYRSTAEIKKKITKKNCTLSQSYKEIIKEIAMIKKILKETPDIRKEKVAEIRAAIKNGTYVVDSRKIAEKMIRESLLQQKLKPSKRDC